MIETLSKYFYENLVQTIKDSGEFNDLLKQYVQAPKKTISLLKKMYGEVAVKILEEEFNKSKEAILVNPDDLAGSLNKYLGNAALAFVEGYLSDTSISPTEMENIFGEFSVVKDDLISVDEYTKNYTYTYHFPKFDKYVSINYSYDSYGGGTAEKFINVKPKQVLKTIYEPV